MVSIKNSILNEDLLAVVVQMEANNLQAREWCGFYSLIWCWLMWERAGNEAGNGDMLGRRSIDLVLDPRTSPKSIGRYTRLVDNCA